MDAIAQAAGVSKQTIYHHFGSKEALFGAIVTDLCEALLAPLAPSGPQESDVRTALVSLARHVLDLALAPDSLAMHRLLIAEAQRAPELGATAYEAGPQRAVSGLARYLAQQTLSGRLRVADPELAAEQFFGMVLGHLQLRALLCEEHGRPSRRWLEHWIVSAVDLFLAAHQAEPGRRGRDSCV